MYLLRVIAMAYVLSVALVGCEDSSPDTPNPASSKQTQTSMDTRAGKLQIAVGENTTPDSLFLNGELVFQREREYLSFYNQYQRGAEDLVLIGSNCGTSCPTDQLYWIVITKGTKPVVVDDPQFYAYPNDVKITQQGDSMAVALGFSQRQRRFADLVGTTLKFRIEPAREEDKVLDNASCEWLHAEALQACMTAKASAPECSNPQTEFPAYIAQRLNAIDEYPAYNAEAFDTLCVAACTKEDISDYKSFASAVCGIR